MKKIITILAFSAVFFSCTTVNTVKTADAVLKFRESKAGEAAGTLSSPLLPGITVYGEKEETQEGFEFYITGIRMFTNWPRGWTDARYEASGIIVFREQEDGWIGEIKDPFELWDISKGEIRYYDNYYRDDEGLRKVKNRIDRINELNRFLKEERELREYYPDILSFEKDTVPLLFPEAERNFSLKKRKVLFSRNSEYSREILPENLVPLRDSGTLWRDFEEASGLMYSLYNLDSIMNSRINGKFFQLTRSAQ